MGSKLRQFLWYSSLVTIMYKTIFAFLFSVAAALPLEDTAEVAAAKEAFATVYKSVDAGEHINLMPVNNDVQAAQIPNMYLDDTLDVAKAKDEFLAEFRNVEAGGLMAKQAPAPVVPEVKLVQPQVNKVVPQMVYNTLPYHNMYYNHYMPLNYKVAAPTVYKATYIPTVYNNAYPVVSYPYAYSYPYVMPVQQQEQEDMMVEEA